jgi:hypothetical protein
MENGDEQASAIMFMRQVDRRSVQYAGLQLRK